MPRRLGKGTALHRTLRAGGRPKRAGSESPPKPSSKRAEIGVAQAPRPTAGSRNIPSTPTTALRDGHSTGAPESPGGAWPPFNFRYPSSCCPSRLSVACEPIKREGIHSHGAHTPKREPLQVVGDGAPRVMVGVREDLGSHAARARERSLRSGGRATAVSGATRSTRNPRRRRTGRRDDPPQRLCSGSARSSPVRRTPGTTCVRP